MQSTCRSDVRRAKLAIFLRAHDFPGSTRIPEPAACVVDARSKVACASTNGWTTTPCGGVMSPPLRGKFRCCAIDQRFEALRARATPAIAMPRPSAIASPLPVASFEPVVEQPPSSSAGAAFSAPESARSVDAPLDDEVLEPLAPLDEPPLEDEDEDDDVEPPSLVVLASVPASAAVAGHVFPLPSS